MPFFFVIASDVVLGFNHLVRLDAHSGELRNNISVDLVKNSARFSLVIKSSPNGKCVFYVICFDMLSVLI